VKIIATENELEKVSSILVDLATEYPVVAFRGDLGAGKTTLIKNMCNLLGLKEAVNSPTFSIVNEYKLVENKSVFHFDFYRLESEEEAYDIGVEDYFYEGNLCLIEWPSKIESLWPEKRIEVYIEIANKGREFTINQIN
jgi:tRNA threonylcarbamoyladenosine biosynthesis protein TsaE